jgi:hypothetical protein
MGNSCRRSRLESAKLAPKEVKWFTYADMVDLNLAWWVFYLPLQLGKRSPRKLAMKRPLKGQLKAVYPSGHTRYGGRIFGGD